jgi:hypothetical protein
MVSNKLKKIEMDFLKQARNSEWCDLAETIIVLEFAMQKEKDPKVLKILDLKLKIFEEEKKLRVANRFDYDYFRRRELELLTEDMYDFEDF